MSGYELLVKAGFDEPTARRLASLRSGEVIQRQVEWLALRAATRSRLGLLRRAIEQDWPKPQGVAPELTETALARGRLFASHYYAGYGRWPSFSVNTHNHLSWASGTGTSSGIPWALAAAIPTSLAPGRHDHENDCDHQPKGRRR